jgi:hypothetical protein
MVLMANSPQGKQDYLYNGDIWLGILCWAEKGRLLIVNFTEEPR